MLHSVGASATMMRSKSVERYARMCEPRGTARARTANSVFDSGSNNFRNGMSGYLLNKQRKPGRVSRANDAKQQVDRPRLSHPVVALHRRMEVCTQKNAMQHLASCNSSQTLMSTAVRRTTGKHRSGKQARGPLFLNAKRYCK